MYMEQFLSSRSNADDVDYLGVDLVPEAIAANRKKFADRRPWKFEVRDVLVGDGLHFAGAASSPFHLIVCRQFLRYHTYADIFEFLRRASSSGSRYLLLSHYVWAPDNVELYPIVDRL